MTDTSHKKAFPRIPVVLIIIALVVLIAGTLAYSYFDYQRMSNRITDTLIKEGLVSITTFEAVARAGLTGTPKWDLQKIFSTIQDMCDRSSITLFAFMTPSSIGNIVYVTPTTSTNFIKNTYTNITSALEKNRYTWGYAPPDNGAELLYVAKPLLLDNAERIGKRTFRFYNVLFDLGSQPDFMRNFRPIRDEARALPIAIVGLPTDEIVALKKRALLHALFVGSGVFLFSLTLISLLFAIQRKRITHYALTRAQADVERLMRSLRRSDRLAILGRMSATMAHELRNPLSAMRGFTQLFHKKAKSQNDDKMMYYAQLILQEIDRLNASITSVLNFSKPVEPQFTHTSVATLCERSVKLISRDTAANNITVISHIPEDLPDIAVDPNLFTQALLNLLINAIDAMPHGGELTLHAAKEGNVVHIYVADTGIGIAPENIKNIFEPFYTTKAKGTGLGLASVENIIAEHGGEVSVESTLGKGTVFHIRLTYTHTNSYE